MWRSNFIRPSCKTIPLLLPKGFLLMKPLSLRIEPPLTPRPREAMRQRESRLDVLHSKGANNNRLCINKDAAR